MPPISTPTLSIAHRVSCSKQPAARSDAAINSEDCARYEARPIGGGEYNHVGDFLRFGGSAERQWLDKVAPPSWKEPANHTASELSPDPGDYRHHRGGEDNGDAHLKNLLVHHQAIVPITDGRLDLGPWQAIFYAEFDGRRPKRLIIKVMGE